MNRNFKLTFCYCFAKGLRRYMLVFVPCVLWLVTHGVASNAFGSKEDEVFPIDDTYIASGTPDAVFGTFNNIWFGSSPTSGSGSLVSVFKFDIPGSPPGGKLDHAVLRFHVFDIRGVSGNVTLSMKRIAENSAWRETNLTWRSYTASTIGPEHLINVPLTTGLNSLDVTSLLQEAMSASESTVSIAIEYPSSNAQGEAVVALWSKEHSRKEQRPSLTVTYVVPPPTPTPGTKYVSLQNDPTGELIPGSALTYTVIVSNGPYTLNNIVVTNTVPVPLVILSDTIDDGAMGWQHHIAGQEISWTLSQLFPNDFAQLHYQAARPTPAPTATPTTLAITKSGPQVVPPGELITYTLRVNNQTPHTLTDVTITDTLPTAFTVVDSGGGLTTTLPAQLVWQETTPLVSGALLTRTFSGRPQGAVTEVVNADYQVHATIAHSDTQETIAAVGTLSVTTLITITPAAMLAPVIINTGACVRWEYAVTGEPFQSGVQCSGPTFNPLRAQWLPFISR
ncbi:MAG TPA: DNRLRE domain-containing protein [Chloroflexi bacterium]|nr:DNRLRE domain-containing protein [Chloroflexota bacterium]